MAWNFEYGGAAPPLPNAAVVSSGSATSEAGSRQTADPESTPPSGCWQILLLPRFPRWIGRDFHPGLHYEGTLRLDWVMPPSESEVDTPAKSEARTARESNIFGSGDLYVVRRDEWWGDCKPPEVEFELEQRIPIFPRADYSHYLRLLRLTVTTPEEVELEFELLRFGGDPAWSSEAELIAKLKKVQIEDDESQALIFTGGVSNAQHPDDEIAQLTIGHVSDFFRRARIEMDKVESVGSFPSGYGDDEDWSTVFERAGWELHAEPSDANRPDLGRPWSGADLHAHMLRWRDEKADALDQEWLYHLLCIPEIDSPLLIFGMMYDVPHSDLENDIPREGAAMAGHERVPRKRPWPKSFQGQRIQDIPVIYFRTAIHEIGHAMGLYHNHNDFGIMQTTDDLAEAGLLPDGVLWAFSPDDARRLRHLPDIWVRPGGLPWGFGYPYGPVSVTDITVEPEDLRLEVVALDSQLPFGAPLRTCLALRNIGTKCRSVPSDISLKSKRLVARVIDPFGTEHPVGAVARYLSYKRFRDLGPGQALYRSETLLLGQRGFLFAAPGVYRVEFDCAWEHRNGRIQVTGGTDVLVLPPTSAGHAEVAREVIASPQLMMPLVFGLGSAHVAGTRYVDEFEKAEQVLRRALKSSVLRSHFAMIRVRLAIKKAQLKKAKKVAAASLRGAARWVDADSRLSPSEIEQLLMLIEASRLKDRKRRHARRLFKTLRRLYRDLKRQRVPMDKELGCRIRKLLRESKGGR